MAIDRAPLESFQFLSGLLLAAYLLRPDVVFVADHRHVLDRACEAAFNAIDTSEVNPLFQIQCHPIHGDSIETREGLWDLVGCRYLEPVWPNFNSFRVRVTPAAAEAALDNSPHRALFERCARVLLERMDADAR
jgi:hypothetical protein